MTRGRWYHLALLIWPLGLAVVVAIFLVLLLVYDARWWLALLLSWASGWTITLSARFWLGLLSVRLFRRRLSLRAMLRDFRGWPGEPHARAIPLRAVVFPILYVFVLWPVFLLLYSNNLWLYLRFIHEIHSDDQAPTRP